MIEKIKPLLGMFSGYSCARCNNPLDRELARVIEENPEKLSPAKLNALHEYSMIADRGIQNTHLNITVPDEDALRKAKDFYENLLGADVYMRSDKPLRFIMRLGNIKLSIEKNPNAVPSQNLSDMRRNHQGFVFYDRDKFVAQFEKLKNASKEGFDVSFWDVRTQEKVSAEDAEITHRRPGDFREYETFFVTDPSGYLLEFQYYANPTANFLKEPAAAA